MKCLQNLLSRMHYLQTGRHAGCFSGRPSWMPTRGRDTGLSFSAFKALRSANTYFSNTGKSQTGQRSASYVKDIVTKWEKEFATKGVPEPESSAQLIAAYVFGKKMIHEVDIQSLISKETEEEINRLCEFRLQRVPVQYVIREWDFHDLTLEMQAPILIPRPETEELVGLVEEDWKKLENIEGKFLDIGCGSGAISLYFLKQLPQVHCVAIDVNEVACNLTLRNAQKYGLQQRLTVINGDIFSESTLDLLKTCGPFCMIVSNPPYIRTAEMGSLQTEVAKFEDHTALHGGEDGLHVVKHILQVSASLFGHIEGHLWFEVGLGHPEMIEDFVHSNPAFRLRYLQTYTDFSGSLWYSILNGDDKEDKYKSNIPKEESAVAKDFLFYLKALFRNSG